MLRRGVDASQCIPLRPSDVRMLRGLRRRLCALGRDADEVRENVEMLRDVDFIAGLGARLELEAVLAAPGFDALAYMTGCP